MRDYLTIGSSPSGEDCAQVGRDDYYERMRKETAAFLRQVRRVCGDEPFGAQLRVKGFPHDFGTYHEVCVVYDDADEVAVEYAYKCEGHDGLEYWDDEAKRELGIVSNAYSLLKPSEPLKEAA